MLVLHLDPQPSTAPFDGDADRAVTVAQGVGSVSLVDRRSASKSTRTPHDCTVPTTWSRAAPTPARTLRISNSARTGAAGISGAEGLPLERLPGMNRCSSALQHMGSYPIGGADVTCVT